MSDYSKERLLTEVAPSKSSELENLSTLKQSLLDNPVQYKLSDRVNRNQAQADVADQLIAEREERERTAYVRDRDLDTFSGVVGQLFAGGEVGARRLVKNAAVAPDTAEASAFLSGVDDRARQLFAESKNRELTEEENAYLDQAPQPTQEQVRTGGFIPSGGKSRRELLEGVEFNLDRAGEIRDVFESSDRERVLNPLNRDRLMADLSASYQANRDYFSRADAAYVEGDYSRMAAESFKGLGKLIAAGAGNLLENPAATFEFIAEQAPQLAVGAYSGKLLGATNLTYGVSIYEDALNNYREENDGAMPSREDAAEMLAFSLSASLAEQVGDVAILNQFKKVPGIRQTLAAAAKAPKAAKKVVNNAITRTLAATARGTATEAATEVYQTAVEENLSKLNTDFDGEKLFTAGVLGGVAGGIFSGVGRAGSELAARAKTGQEQKIGSDDSAKTDALQINAIETGDISPLLNPEDTENYNPAKAAMALAVRATADDVDVADQQSAREQINELADTQDARVAELEAQFAAETGLPRRKIARELEQAREYAATVRLSREFMLSPEKAQERVEVDGLIETVNQEEDSPERQEAATQVIQLLMRSPDAVSEEQIDELATSAALTPEQRTLVQSYSEANAALNAARGTKGVREVLVTGSTGFKGINQYRSDVANAIREGNIPRAEAEIAQLRQFYSTHSAKAAAAKQAQEQMQVTGKTQYIYREPNGAWNITDQKPWKSRIEQGTFGGWAFNPRGKGPAAGLKFVEDVQAEVDLIAASGKAMAAMVSLTESESVADVNEGFTEATPPPISDEELASIAEQQEVADEVVESDPAPVQAPEPETAVAPETAQSEDEQVEVPAQPEAPAEVTQADPEVAEEPSVDDEIAALINAESTEIEVEEGTLSVFGRDTVEADTESDAATQYRSTNLVQRFFNQTGAGNALVEVKDFLSLAIQNPEIITEFVEEMTEQQAALWGLFAYFTKDSSNGESTEDMLRRQILEAEVNENFLDRDLIQYLRNDLDENILTAMSAAGFTWLVENGSFTTNNDDTIRIILGEDNQYTVTPQDRELLAEVGSRQNLVIQELGQKAVQALGLGTTQDAPANLRTQLELSMGTHTLKMLEAQGLVETTMVNGARISGEANSADHPFVRPTRTAEGVTSPVVMGMVEQARGTKGFINNVFSVDRQLTEPQSEPGEFSQKTAQNTRQPIPKLLTQILNKVRNRRHYIRQDMKKIRESLTPEAVRYMAGYVNLDLTYVHPVNQASQVAKNESIEREIDRLNEFEALAEDNGFYFTPNVWSQYRVGLKENLVNPQTSKVQRHNISMEAWRTTVDPNEAGPVRDRFLLAVAQGMGIDVDKQLNSESFAQLDALVNDPTFQKGIEAIRAIDSLEDGETLAPQLQIDLANAVDLGGENMHSLDALVNYEQFDRGQPFTTEMMFEVDGVTNGPALAQVLLGQMNAGLGAMVGMFTQGSTFKHFTDYKQGNQPDLYERMVVAIQEQLDGDAQGRQAQALIQTIMGPFVSEDGSLKKGRKRVKTPLTSMIFGASPDKATKAMANEFIATFYEQVEAAVNSNDETKLAALTDAAQRLSGTRMPIKTETLTNGLQVPRLNKAQEAGIIATFDATIGDKVRIVLKRDFGAFLETRKQMNEMAQAAAARYSAAFDYLREEKIKQLIERGEMPVGKTGKPLRDLTQDEVATIERELAPMKPVVNTMFSKLSGEPAAGIDVAKTDRRIAEAGDNLYEAEVAVGGQRNAKGKQSKIRPRGLKDVAADPGVRAVIMMVHSLDSAIASYSYSEVDALNIHDALGLSMADTNKGAEALNRNTFTMLTNYSVGLELLAMLDRSFEAQEELVQRFPGLESVLDNVEIGLGQDKTAVDTEFREAAAVVAYDAELAKLAFLEQLEAVDQYALEGGTYEVTEEMRQRVSDLRATVTAKANSRIEGPSRTVTPLQIDPQPSIPEVTPYGRVGQAQVDSDPELVELVSKNPTLKGVLPVLAKKIKEGNQSQAMKDFQVQLLRMAFKSANPNTRIRYIEPNTEWLGENDVDNARGWYSLDDRGERISVKSPDFVTSGITTEMLLHEITHASVAQVIAGVEAGNFNKKSDQYKAYEGLQTLLEQARTYIEVNEMSGFENATESVQELVAWGLTNPQFQSDVLAKIPYNGNPRNAAERRVARTGFKAFIDFIAQLFGRGNDDYMKTGLGSLILNTAVMFDTQAQRQPEETTESIQLRMVAPDPRQYTPEQIFDALANVSPNRVAHPTRQRYMKVMLNAVVSAVYPNGSIRQEALQKAPATADDVYFNALSEGKAPYASASLGVLPLNAQEAFVLESVEVAVDSAIERAPLIRKEILAVFRQARQQLSARDFHKGDWDQASPDQQEQAQRIYDFIFNIENDVDGKSRFLSRFVAAGVAYEGLNDALGSLALAPSEATVREGTFAERISALLEKLMTYLTRLYTKTYDGQKLDSAMSELAVRLATIEQKKKASIAKTQDRPENVLARSVKSANDTIRAGADRFGRSVFFRQSRFGLVQGAGAAVSTVAGDRTGEVMDLVKRVRDGVVGGREGLISTIATEAKGETDLNTQFHQLLAWANGAEQSRKRIMMDVGKALRDEFGTELTREQETAITRVVLRTDLQSLTSDYDLAQIEELLRDSAKRRQLIKQLEGQLNDQFGRYQQVQAQALGHHLATGKVSIGNLMLNAHNIAHMGNTKHSGQNPNASQVESVIDQLATLWAVEYSSAEQRTQVADLMRSEANRDTNANGMQMVLSLYREFQKESLEQLFDNDPVLMLKGYTKDTYNPHIEVKAATELEGFELERAGYTRVTDSLLPLDPADPNAQPKHLYVIRDGGLSETISGFMSQTGRKGRGSMIHGGIIDTNGNVHRRNVTKNAVVRNARDRDVEGLMKAPKNWSPLAATQQSHLVPVMSPTGDAVNYRYLMKEETKDNILERDNRMSTVMGHIAGSIFDKVHSPTLNRQGIDAMYADYRQNAVSNPDAYIEFGPNSADPVIRERYRLLPQDTRDYIRKVWGQNGMRIRNDLYNISFGYRKFSLREVFEREPADRNWAERIFAGVLETFFGKKAALRVTQAENVWQELVKTVKDIWVIKNLVTLLGNESSNMFLLKLAGVPISSIIRDKITAYKATIEFARARREHDNLQRQLDAGYLGDRSVQEVQSRMRELEDSMARSPVKDLVDAGMFQTLVEDIGNEEDEYSYKSKLNRWVGGKTEWVPSGVKSIGKTLLMTHDTPLYQVLNRATIYSDFTARYVLHQHYTKRSQDPLDAQESLRRIREAFVNYDVPTHKAIQYLNDTGVLWFTKYYVRIQKVIFQLVRENPLNAVLVWALGDWLFNLPDILDSSILTKSPGNLGLGALELPGAIDEIVTLRAAGL